MSPRPYDHLANGSEADRAEFTRLERASTPPASTLADELRLIADSFGNLAADAEKREADEEFAEQMRDEAACRRAAAALEAKDEALWMFLDGDGKPNELPRAMAMARAAVGDGFKPLQPEAEARIKRAAEQAIELHAAAEKRAEKAEERLRTANRQCASLQEHLLDLLNWFRRPKDADPSLMPGCPNDLRASIDRANAALALGQEGAK